VSEGKHGLVDAIVDGICVLIERVDVNVQLPNGTGLQLTLGSLALSSTTSDYEVKVNRAPCSALA
jgi:hypothetical protein